MFFDILELGARKRDVRLRELPAVPDTQWRPPQYFPDLSQAAVIAIDVETHETDFDHGPGWGRGTGYICGFSVAWAMPDGVRGKLYFPVRHSLEPDWNMDPATCFRWLKATLETPRIPKVGAHLLYDIGWLTTENIWVEGELWDVQYAEALLDEKGKTALDFLAGKYLGRAKTTDVVKDWILRAYPGANDTNWRGYLWCTPPRLVGYYGEDDADLPLDILCHQWARLEAEELVELFRMECAGIPMLIRMRLDGVEVDVNEARTIRNEIEAELVNKYVQLAHISGVVVEGVASSQLKPIFDRLQIPYRKSANGNPSFTKSWLTNLKDAYGVGALINSIREYEKIRDTFLDAYILNRSNSGRIYCSFHPLRLDGDGGELGAKTGRYASSDPNLQNIPVRSKLGKRVRSVFVPRHFCWEKNDHSQIEYRMLANFAVGPGAENLRKSYRDNPKIDYHQMVMNAFAAMQGIDLSTYTQEQKDDFRRPIKNVNFGLMYGQGGPKLAISAGLGDKADAFLKGYHETAPYVRETMTMVSQEVQGYGYVRTLLGRRTRFDTWEPDDYGKRGHALPLEAAVRQWGSNIHRAYDYRGTNYKFQGSAADVLKMGMLRCHQSGVFEATGYPRLQVHDELDFDVIDDSPYRNEAHREMRHLLETACQDRLSVPLSVDWARGKNWGATK